MKRIFSRFLVIKINSINELKCMNEQDIKELQYHHNSS